MPEPSRTAEVELEAGGFSLRLDDYEAQVDERTEVDVYRFFYEWPEGYDPRTHHRASTTLVESVGDPFRLHAVHADDNDPSTCWYEGAPGDGVGEWLEYSWERPREFSGLTIINGYAASEELFDGNARPARLRLDYSTGKSETIELEDTLNPQSFELRPGGGVDRVRMTIEAVYPGDHWEDCCLAEARFA